MKVIDYEKHRANKLHLPLDVLVLVKSEKCAGELEGSLSGIGSLHHRVQRYTGSRPLESAVSDPAPDIVILEAIDSGEETLEGIREFVDRHGQSSELFVTLDRPDMQSIKRFLQCGAGDIVTRPVDDGELCLALANASERLKGKAASASRRKGAVLSFMSTHTDAGGGCLALEMAYQLAGCLGRSSVLLDLDVQFGTLANALDIRSEGGLVEALKAPERIDEVFLDALMASHASGLKVLSSPGDLDAAHYLTPHAVARLISVLARSHDHVVVNLPLHVDEAVEQVFRLSDPLYLVTRDSLSNLRNLGMMLQRLPMRGISLEQIEVIHNRLDKGSKFVTGNDVRKLIGDCPLHEVRNDCRMAARADNHGKSISELYPRASMTRDIRAIASGVAVPFAAENNGDSRSRGLARWFS